MPTTIVKMLRNTEQNTKYIKRYYFLCPSSNKNGSKQHDSVKKYPDQASKRDVNPLALNNTVNDHFQRFQRKCNGLILPSLGTPCILFSTYRAVAWQSSVNKSDTTLPRSFFVKVLHKCEALAMWPKLTADWLLSLSAMTGSSVIAYCKMS